MSLAPTNERDLVDAMGTVHEVAGTTARIVSLVPSITELLFDLGLASQVVGRTGFCVHPHELVKRVVKVGGTKSIDTLRIKRLAPTHLIVNIDENPRATVEELARFVPHVIVTHPLAPADNSKLYRLLGRIFSREEAAEVLCNRFESAHQETLAAAAAWPRQKVLYLIWKAPWMTVSRDTYIARMLGAVGWDTHALSVHRADARRGGMGYTRAEERVALSAGRAHLIHPESGGRRTAVHRALYLPRAALRRDHRPAAAGKPHPRCTDRRRHDLMVWQPRDPGSHLPAGFSRHAEVTAVACATEAPLTTLAAMTR
jgi:hypothetical protein